MDHGASLLPFHLNERRFYAPQATEKTAGSAAPVAGGLPGGDLENTGADHPVTRARKTVILCLLTVPVTLDR